MANIETRQDGPWNNINTWQGATVPTSADVAIIKHTVTVSGTCESLAIRIYPGGGLIANTYDTPALVPKTTLVTGRIWYYLTADTAPLRLDGIRITKSDGTPYATFGATDGTGAQGFGACSMIENGTDGVIIDDTGIFNASTTLQDIKPEGCGRAYTRKIGNAVRYLALTIRLPRSEDMTPYYIRYLYQWADMPFQVIAVNGSCIIKGYVESVVYDQASIGTAYHVFRITVAEGEQ